MINNDADIPRHRKKKPSSVSKSKKKPNINTIIKNAYLLRKKKKIIHTEPHIALFAVRLETYIFLKVNAP